MYIICALGQKKIQYISRIGMGVIIGSSTNVIAGVSIVPNTIVGYASNVVKDIMDPGIYVGNPAKKINEVPETLVISLTENREQYNFDLDRLQKYLPYSIY